VRAGGSLRDRGKPVLILTSLSRLGGKDSYSLVLTEHEEGEGDRNTLESRKGGKRKYFHSGARERYKNSASLQRRRGRGESPERGLQLEAPTGGYVIFQGRRTGFKKDNALLSNLLEGKQGWTLNSQHLKNKGKDVGGERGRASGKARKKAC